jgi:hypothetical protein
MAAAQVHRQARADTGYAGFTQGGQCLLVIPGRPPISGLPEIGIPIAQVG